MIQKLLAVITAASVVFLSGYETNSYINPHVTQHSAAAEINSAQSNKTTFGIAKPVDPHLPLIEGKSPDIGDDGYLFEGAQSWNTTFKVRVVTYPNLAAIRQKFGDKQLVAETFFPSQENGNTCTINIVDPRKLYWPQYIGHEFVHCMVGDFHVEQDLWGKIDSTK